MSSVSRVTLCVENPRNSQAKVFDLVIGFNKAQDTKSVGKQLHFCTVTVNSLKRKLQTVPLTVV